MDIKKAKVSYSRQNGEVRRRLHLPDGTTRDLTPEEIAEHEASSRQDREKDVADWKAAIDAIATDPNWKPPLHNPRWHEFIAWHSGLYPSYEVSRGELAVSAALRAREANPPQRHAETTAPSTPTTELTAARDTGTDTRRDKRESPKFRLDEEAILAARAFISRYQTAERNRVRKPNLSEFCEEYCRTKTTISNTTLYKKLTQNRDKWDPKRQYGGRLAKG